MALAPVGCSVLEADNAVPCRAMLQARARLRAVGGGFKQWARSKAQQDGAVATAATCPSLGVLCRGCHAVLGAGSHCGKASLGAVWACEVTHILVASCGGTHWSHPLPRGKPAVSAEPGTPLPGCPVSTSDQTPMCPLFPPPVSPSPPPRRVPSPHASPLFSPQLANLPNFTRKRPNPTVGWAVTGRRGVNKSSRGGSACQEGKQSSIAQRRGA